MGVYLLNEQQIIQGIKRYLNDKLYKYAVLIDGEWGCRDADRLLDAYHFNQVKGDSSTSTQTRADKIRGFSDEELARWLITVGRCPDGYTTVFGPHCVEENGCEWCWLEWLRQEAVT